MSEAFIYMFVVGSGASSGVAIVGLLTWRIVLKIQNKKTKKTNLKGAF